MRRNGGDRRARGGVRDGMATAGRAGAALFMMHSSFSTAASSWMMTPPPLGGRSTGGCGRMRPLSLRDRVRYRLAVMLVRSSMSFWRMRLMARSSLGLSAMLFLCLVATGRAADNSAIAAAHLAVPKFGTVDFRPTEAESTVPQLFHLKSHRFSFETEYTRASGPVRIYKVRFPSPVVTKLKVNNTVHGHYFQPPGKGPFPGVVVLHILGGDFALSQMIANGLARRNVAALFIRLPYYGERRGDSRERFISFEPDVTRRNFRQAVLDIRRAAAWLGSRPEVDAKQLGVTGISLGGIMSALAAAGEPRFGKVAVYLGGGNLGEMVWTHDNRAAVAFRKSWIARGETRESFLKKTRPVDPATYGHLLKSRTVLMVAARNDTIVPPDATMALWNSMGRKPKLVWLDAGHISAAQFLYGEMERLGKFFQPSKK